MTTRKQLMYMGLFFLIFVIVIPAIVLYSLGYRIGDNFGLVKTGGLYFVNDESDVKVFLNDKLKKESGFIEKDILIQNLKPGNYHAEVKKEGYRLWEKWVKVSPEKVEVLYPLLIKEKLGITEIPRYENIAAAKKKKINEEYTDVLKLFEKKKKPSKKPFFTWTDPEEKKLRLSEDRKLRDKVFLYRNNNNIYVRWIGKEEKLPFFINSMKPKLIFTSETPFRSFDFFPGRNDSFIVHLSDGSLLACEIDNRFGNQNFYKIVKYCDRYIIDDEELYYFIGSKLFVIDFGN
jgi:hypothetical protein